ncbi:MAG: hypothetical protein WCF94_00295 [bacterium]
MSADLLINKILENIINPMVYFLMVVAIIVFIWGLVQYINKEAPADKHKEGIDKMIYGAIGLTIMFSAQGIIHILLDFLGR